MPFRLLLFNHILMAAMVLGNTANGQDTSYLRRPPLEINRLNSSVTIDGYSNEPAWQNALSLPFIVFDPVWGQKETEKTELLITYDTRYLYAAGRCYTKDTTTIIARNLVRDGWRGDDWMTLHIDSRFDKQTAFVFSIYPLGSRYDLATSNDAIELGNATFNPAFNMIWEAKSVINNEGWFFEMKIPLYNLRFQSSGDDNIMMGISATRAIQKKQEYHQFPAIPRNAIEPIMKPSLKQPVVFQNIPKQHLLLISPYISLSRNRSNSVVSNVIQTNTNRKFQPGLDVKAGISSYLTLDITINPDFSQVEADNQMVNLTRFSLFFPERRLFFQEQAGLFEFGLGKNSQLFYSRRIGINDGQLTNIYGGARLTGQLGKTFHFGLLGIQTAPVTLQAGTQINSESFTAGRFRKRVLNDRSFIGFMFTGRNRDNYYNYSAGADALLNIKRTHYLMIGAAATIDKIKTGSRIFDASRLSVQSENRRTDNWHHKLGYIFSGPSFSPAAGFIDRGNFHNYWGVLNFGKFAKERKGLFQYKKFTVLNFDSYQNAGNSKWETIELSSSVFLRTFKGFEWNGGVYLNSENLLSPLDFGNDITIEPGSYQFIYTKVGFTPPRFKTIRIPAQLSYGSFYNGARLSLVISPTLNFGKHWEIQSSYDYSYLRFDNKNLHKKIHIIKIQVNYAYDLHLSVSLISQYNSIVRQVFNNLRFRYNFKDGHDFHIVWNENFFQDRRITSELLRPVSGNQAFILKYSYTLTKKNS